MAPYADDHESLDDQERIELVLTEAVRARCKDEEQAKKALKKVKLEKMNRLLKKWKERLC